MACVLGLRVQVGKGLRGQTYQWIILKAECEFRKVILVGWINEQLDAALLCLVAGRSKSWVGKIRADSSRLRQLKADLDICLSFDLSIHHEKRTFANGNGLAYLRSRNPVGAVSAEYKRAVRRRRWWREYQICMNGKCEVVCIEVIE
jgi:hypothetical protein